LESVALPHRLLQRAQVAAAGEPLDGGDVGAVGLHPEHEARPSGSAIDEDGAGTAYAVLTAEMRSGEAQFGAQHVGEGLPRLDCRRPLLAVDRDRDLCHVRSSCASSAARSSALRTTTRARCTRYALLPCRSADGASPSAAASAAASNAAASGARPRNASSASGRRTGWSATPI